MKPATIPWSGALAAIAILTDPARVFAHPSAQPIIQALGLTEPKQLLLPLIIAFGLAALIAGAMRLLLLWASTRLSFAAGADLSLISSSVMLIGILIALLSVDPVIALAAFGGFGLIYVLIIQQPHRPQAGLLQHAPCRSGALAAIA